MSITEPTFKLAVAHTCVPQVGTHEVVVIVTVDDEAVQGELDIVHCSTAVPGTAKPVTPEVGELGLVMVAVPENTVHVPVPTTGVLPPKVAVLTPHAGFIAEPALDVVGAAETLTEAVLTPVVQAQVLPAANV